MAADASTYGFGAVISHIFLDDSEQAVAYTPQTLTTAGKNYNQIAKDP